MRVEVTRADIRSGQRYSAGSCPIARAIIRPRKRSVDVSVELGTQSVLINNREYALPPIAVDFALMFDARGQIAVKPVTFSMERIPNER